MPLELQTLGAGTLVVVGSGLGTNSAHKLYQAPTAPEEAAIVHGMRFTNRNGTTRTIQLYFLKKDDDLADEKRLLLPKDLKIPGGYTVIDEDQLTLSPGDAIYGVASADDAIDWALSGAERPV